MKVLTRAFPKSILFLLLFVIFSLIHSEEASAVSLWDRYTININLADKHGDTYLVGERATFSIGIRRGVLRFSLSRGFYYRYDYYNIPARNLRTTFPDYHTEVGLTRTGTGRYEYRTSRLEEIGPQTLTVRIGIRSWLGFLTLARRSYSINVQGPPTIEITNPEDGSLFNTDTITVSGTVNDNEADVEVNEITADVSDYRFSAEVPLEEGENEITARATNPFGESEDSITVTVDTIPPNIRVTSPGVSTVTETPISVTGTTDDPDAAISVNGIPAVNIEGNFRVDGIPLSLGENVIVIEAVDPAGNPNRIILTIIYNPDPPPEEIPESGFITGNVYHSRTLAPLPSASITVNGIEGQALSNAEGSYRFPINEFPEENSQFVEVVISKTGFTTCYRKVEVTSTRHTAVEQVYLTPVDPEVTVIEPDPINEQHHTSADGSVELIFPPGSVPHEIEVTATNFQHSRELPAPLPDTSFFTYCVDLQPGVEFNEPVILRVANELGFAPSTQIPIGIYNEETLRWEDTGWMGIVTSDGDWVEAQLEHFSPCDLNFPPPVESPPPSTGEQTSSIQNSEKEAIEKGCRISIKTGNFGIDHNLPSTRILGIPQSLTLAYSSNTANPNIIIDAEINNNSWVTVPDMIKWELSVEGLHQERYFEGASNNIRFPYLYNCRNSDGELLPTGRYSYSVEVSNVYTNETYWTADRFGGPPIRDTGVPLREPLFMNTEQKGHFIVNSQQNSPFGSGWGLTGLQRLQRSPDGDAVITDGDGSSVAFAYGKFLYVEQGFQLLVLDPNNCPIDTISLDMLNMRPGPILISPNSRLAYIGGGQGWWSSGGHGHFYSGDNIAILDLYRRTIVDRIEGTWNAGDMILSTDGNRLYALGSGNEFYIIDTEENRLLGTIGGIGGGGIDRGSRLDRVYVASGNLYIIDPIAQNIVATVPMEEAPSVGVTPDDRYAYVATLRNNFIPVVDLNTNTIIANIYIPADPDIYPPLPRRVIMHPSGDRVYVGATVDVPTDGGTTFYDEIIVIDTSTHFIISRIRLNEGIISQTFEFGGRLFFSSDGKKLFISPDQGVALGYMGIEINTDPLSPDYHTAEIFINNNFIEGTSIVAQTPTSIFYAPLGESSYLIQNPDNTYIRFCKDGNHVHFNEDGMHTSTVDRNGNTITYTYDEQERLITAMYPDNQIYTFQYNPATEKLNSITDPVGRIMYVEIDGNGNLVGITNPDGTVKQYTYDDHHLMTSVTNSRGETYQFEYDEYGRLQRTIDPETTVIVDGIEQRIEPQKQFQPADVQHIINNLPPGMGTFDNPAPIVRSEDIQAQVTDPRGNSYTARLGRFGSILRYTDSLGRITQYTRDQNGNPTQIIRPNGTEINLTYDNLSNLTSITEETIDATTVLTYDLDFSQITSITDPLGNETTIDYNESGNPVTITDALGNQVDITWNEQGLPLTATSHLESEDINTSFTYYPGTWNLHTITNPGGETTTITYDDAGNITEIEDALGRITRYTYNLSNNRLTEIEDALGNITQYEYDTTGNITQITDANGNTVRFGYNELGQLISVTNPLGAVKQFWYDPVGNLVKIRDYNRDEITYVYDTVNRLIEKHWSGGEVTTYSYDALDGLTNIINPASRLQFNYDPVGRLIQAITIAGAHQPEKTINYTYDNNGNRLTLNEPALGSVIYTWDALNRLQQLQDFNGRITAFGYDSLSRRTSLNIPDILTNTYQYDNASRLLSIIASASEPISYNYTYNDVGNRTSFTDPLGVHNYEYDNIDQLIQATHPILPDENFTYDTLGNRDPLTNTYDIANRLLENLDHIYTYDTNGNMITREDIDTGEITTYHYNVENQLIQIDLPDGTTVNYFYDGLGRRIEKNVGGGVARFVYDGMDVLAEYNGANELIRSYVHGPSIDEQLELNAGPSTYYYISDGLGSIIALIDSSSNIIEQYRYDAFGNVTILNADGDEISESAVGNRYMFTAREYNTETGLYYYRLRYYDPIVGRFLQEDPIGYLLGPNLYTYVNNNPVNWIDPWGLYGSDVHYEKTKEWGKEVGLPSETAEKIASYNQGEDRGLSGPFNWPIGTRLHFRDRAYTEKGLQDAINRGDLQDFGRYLHQYQDSYTHYDEGFRWWTFGHIGWSSLPDFYDPNTLRDQRMERGTREWLEEWRKHKEN